MMFGRKKVKKVEKLEYDRENYKPVRRCSICTGEQTGGLRNIHTGQFTDVMLIRDDDDLETFKEMCGVEEVPKIY